MYIGPYQLSNNLIVAPMAGVTDRPFRTLCKYFGAGHAVSEMMTSDQTLRMSKKSLYRANFDGELAPISAQIAGSDPLDLAEAARFQVANGAQIVDINMGCPAKKVCNKLAGSAVLKDEDLVARILDTVVAAVDVPVTLKTRLGYLNGHENIMRVAKRAEQAGIAALALHGRTREDMYLNTARYRLIKEVKQMLSIPVIANGDITSLADVDRALLESGADGIMIGRGSYGRPWFVAQACAHLKGIRTEEPPLDAQRDIVLNHYDEILSLYGINNGVRVARKHIGWYSSGLEGGAAFRFHVNKQSEPEPVRAAIIEFYDGLLQRGITKRADEKIVASE